MAHRTSRFPFLLGASASCAALTACTTPSTRGIADSTASVPAHWQAGAGTLSGPLDAAALAAWWTRFDDPVLDRLMADALAGSPDVRTMIARVEQARASRGIERAALRPSVAGEASGNGSRTRHRDTYTTAKSQSYSASVGASWEIDLFGRQRAALGAADADLAESEELHRASRVALAAEVATTYVALRSAEAQLAVVERSLATREETAELTRWREQAGSGDALATQQSLATLEQTRASLPSLRQTIAQTRNQLALLAGRPPGYFDALLAPARPVPAIPPALAIGIPADTLRQRPDVRAAAKAVDAAVARRKVAERDRLPSLNLTGSIGVEALSAGDLFSPPTAIRSLAGSLTAPIFSAGRLRQAVVVQDQLARQALIAYESTVLRALSEVENALVAVQRSAERLESLGRAAAAAREAADLASLQFRAGQVDLLTVLDAQRTLLSLEEQQTATAADRADAHIQLYQALGGGWAPESPALSSR